MILQVESLVMRKRVLAVWLAIMVLGFGVSSVSADGTVILDPGHVMGTISVTGETVTGGFVDAYSIPPAPPFDGHVVAAQGGEYYVTVEGGYDYEVVCQARIHDDTSSEYTTDTILYVGREERFVPVATDEDPYVTLDFSMDPGYITPVVTVTGGYIDDMEFTVDTDYAQYAASHFVFSKGGNYLDGTTSFPMKPWECVDINEDGDCLDIDIGETYLSVTGAVLVNGLEYLLPPQYIDVALGESTYVYWSLNVEPGNIHGSVNVEGENINYFYIRGSADFAGQTVNFNQHFSGDTYSLDLPPSTWSVHPSLYIHESGNYYQYNILRLPADTVVVPPGGEVEHNWNIVPGYVTGTANLYGAYGTLTSLQVRAQGPSYNTLGVANSLTNNYELILFEGDWRVGKDHVYLNFDHGYPFGTSKIDVIQSDIEPTTVTAGSTVSDVDFSYGTATVTVNFLVEGGGELTTPRLFASLTDGPVGSNADSTGIEELVTVGVSTITILEGSHIVSAYATVQGSLTRFGEFTISVDPGDVINQDIGAPTADVIYPDGLQHFCGPSILVNGTATDDTEVSKITVNGQNAEFVSTENPDDPNEVFFSKIVGGMELGENTLTIVVTDTSDKTVTVERTIIRDLCNLPPEIIAIAGPSDPVSVENSVDMFATFTDPDIDDSHTAVWDWGDETTSAGTVDQTERTVTGSHYYDTPGVYTVTLTVTDSYGESDTDTWTQYIVIYDPADGFVTGGGWIDSPLGAFPADPTLTGTANFGFVAKYKKGADVPMGTTEFQFHAGDINLHSDSYDWLVIAGAKAMFKGTGTINGDDSYKFLVTVVDGKLIGDGVPDTFRIKIWTENEVTGEEFIIYDNGPDGTVLGGGSITIHKG
jgi:PKD repeat protein